MLEMRMPANRLNRSVATPVPTLVPTGVGKFVPTGVGTLRLVYGFRSPTSKIIGQQFLWQWLIVLSVVWLCLILADTAVCQTGSPAGGFQLVRIKYRGGGDWYSDPTSLPNLLREVEQVLGLETPKEEVRLSIMDEALFSYPFLYMTGHGKVKFSEEEAARLRRYLVSGGFLWADDNYGMDEYLRRELRKVFPETELVELPFDHEIYHVIYDFSGGLPKIHEHHGGPPHGYGILHEGRVVVFYSYNTDIGDGLEDAEVHRDPPEKREAAKRMAVNIVAYALTH